VKEIERLLRYPKALEILPYIGDSPGSEIPTMRKKEETEGICGDTRKSVTGFSSPRDLGTRGIPPVTRRES
jgi:hypothetical protein